jgi:GGDEF domain-containing protein
VRYGGEEFLVVLPEMRLVDAMRIAERIRRSIETATIPNRGSDWQGHPGGRALAPLELAAIDAWIAASNDKTLTRAHAIRRLVAIGLKAKPK